MEETISLKEIFQTLRKRLVMIIVITLAATAISAIATYFFMTPKYDASTQILVNQSDKNGPSSYNPGQLQANVQFINTYSVIIKSPAILDDVIKTLNLNMTPDELKQSLTINSAQESQVFTVSVENNDPAMAVKLANGVANVFSKKIPTIMNVDNVSVLSKAQLSDNPAPVSPNPKLNMAIAFVVGLMVSVGLAFLIEYLDNTIKTEEDIEKTLGLPVLGAVMDIDHHEAQAAQKTQAKRTARSGSYEA